MKVMKIAIYSGLLLCLLIIIVGIVIWFEEALFLVKLTYSVLCILAGISLGAIGISIIKDDF